ncbi:MarR family transcriptional regulator [Sphingobium sp. H33]|uniref:MarR family transcriptional regulator n=1 Tax=Sphingobium nicotianae TaxID=2782607 RepID=A0A9X1DE32_9SPHN|nr:MarR family transcriptional regulator [Sphingobium nicotianae]
MRALDRLYNVAILKRLCEERTLAELIDEKVAGGTRAPMHERLVGARLFGLIRLVRESGVHAYEREIGYKEIQRQLIIMIGVTGGLSSHEIVSLTGHEKAQVSRAIKPLEEAGLIERERLRAKLTLLPPGKKIFDRIMTISRARDAALTAGIEADDLKRFIAMTEELTRHAATLYAEERRLSAEAGVIGACSAAAGPPAWPTGPDGRKPTPLLTPKLISLIAYLKRSAMLAYQRSHGLSHFQWQVLAIIGETPPVPLARLIVMMGRDKSQVGRTVAHLEQAGLIERTRPTRRRDIMLEPTAKGADFFQSLYDLAMRREDALWSGHDAAGRAFYIATIDRLTVNARDMLEKEEAA